MEIHDATLRDGEQTPGVVFSVDDKIRIASKLNEIGVDRIEAGMPAVSPQDAEAIREISKLGLNSKIYTFARAMKADIDMALECGAQGVIIEVPIGYPKAGHAIRLDLGGCFQEKPRRHQLCQGMRPARRVLSL